MGLSEDGCHDLYDVLGHVGKVIAIDRVPEKEQPNGQ